MKNSMKSSVHRNIMQEGILNKLIENLKKVNKYLLILTLKEKI